MADALSVRLQLVGLEGAAAMLLPMQCLQPGKLCSALKLC